MFNKGLPHKVTLYIPAEELAESTAKLLAELFGGSTSSKSIGYWIDAKGSLVEDNIIQVYAFAQELNQFALSRVYNHALEVQRLANQDCVAVEIDGQLHFVDGRAAAAAA